MEFVKLKNIEKYMAESEERFRKLDELSPEEKEIELMKIAEEMAERKVRIAALNLIVMDKLDKLSKKK